MQNSGISWINDLQTEGYNYIIMPKGSRKKFYATKGNMLKTRVDFRDSVEFDEFKFEENEIWPFGSEAKGIFINLNC